MRTRTTIQAAVMVLLCALATGCRVNPVTGQSDFVLVSEQRELALGDEAHPNIVQMYDGRYHDPPLEAYLSAIVQRIRDFSHRSDVPVDFTVLNTSVVNAFATPGHLYATRGFLARMQNEAQFASVMGHEWAHVAALHTAKQMSRDVAAQFLLGVGGSLLGDSGSAQVATQVAAVGVTMLGLQYSRTQEREADKFGTHYMAHGGWAPYQAVEVMEILASLNKRKPGALDRYLSTHPGTDERIQNIRQVIANQNLANRYVQGDGIFEDRWNRKIRTLVQVDKDFEPYDEGTEALAENDHDRALRLAQQAIRRNPNMAQFHRLKGDALLGMGRTDEAREAYDRSLALYPHYEPAALGQGRVALRTGRYAAAEDKFERVTRNWPGSVDARYLLGLAHYHQEEFRSAIPPLESVAEAAPRNATVWYVLGTCYDRTGANARAVQAYQAAVDNDLAGTERQRAVERIEQLKPLLQKPE